MLRHATNQRLGRALRSGFDQTTGDHVAVVDCDLSYAPDHITRMLHAAQDTGAQIVIASPYMKGGTTTNVPFVRRVLSRGANRLLAAAAGGGLTTLTGMVRVYDGPFIRSLDLRADDAEINIEIIDRARRLHARIVEVPAHLDWSFAVTDGHRRPVGGRLGGATASSLRWSLRFARRRTAGSAARSRARDQGPRPERAVVSSGRTRRREVPKRVSSVPDPLAAADPELAGIVRREVERQNTTIQLIASENFTSPAVMAAQGTVLTNKYSEGYPGQAVLRRQPRGRRGRGARPHPRLRRCSAPSTPTCSRTPVPTRTWRRSSRCSSPATRSWACAWTRAATSRTARR